MDLRPYQVEAVNDARERLRGGSRRVLIVMPTGGGKTVLAGAIIQSAVSKGSRVLFLAHRRELIAQTSDKLRRFGVPHGIVMAGESPALQESVQVASVQTLIRRPGVVSAADLIFIDEAHHTTKDNTYSQLLEWYPDAKVVGLTATPWRLDGKGLNDVFDSWVIARTPAQLLDEGFLVPLHGYRYESIEMESAKIRGGEYVMSSIEESAIKTIGNVVSEWKAHAADRLTVAFCVSVGHSIGLAQRFSDEGVTAEHVDADTAKGEREAIFARLRAGTTRVLCNVGIATEGWDFPELSCVILARPTCSESLALQMMGRVLRPAPGKESARAHDHAGIIESMGGPFAERSFEPLDTLPKKTGSVHESHGEKGIQECPNCGAVLTGGRCLACGYLAPIEEVEAVAFEIDGTSKPKSGQSKRKTWAEEDRKNSWKYKTLEQKIDVLRKMILRHGKLKAPRVYFWISGNTEYPSSEVRAVVGI